jgi:tripartite-type tricarboxylate transporter receptor subunit TctC
MKTTRQSRTARSLVRACAGMLGWAVTIAATLMATTSRAAETGDYPNRPIRLVVPFAPGSATDTMARLLANELTQRLGQTVVVDDRPGAFGQIAAVHVARSAPDGYTVFMTTNTTHSANPHLYRTLAYDPVKDFDPVVRSATLPFVVICSPTLPVKTMRELVAYGRSRPDGLTFASASSSSLVAAETIARLGQVKLVSVLYKASPQAIGDVASGRVDMMVADIAIAMPQITGGRVRLLGVATEKRLASLPDTPPVADTLKGFEVGSWNGLLVPAGTPKPIIARLARELISILTRPDIAARLTGMGFEVEPLGPEPFAAYLRSQLDTWGRLIRDAGIQPQ